MKSFDIDKNKIIKVDFSGSAKALNPIVYEERGEYFCFLGSSRKRGVLGSGKTVDEAIKNWDINLQDRLLVADNEDEVVIMVKKLLAGKRPIASAEMKRFHDQFRPLKKK